MGGGPNKLSGNILWYNYISKVRAPVFLNRNLIRALRIHQFLLKSEAAEDSENNLSEESEDDSDQVFAGRNYELRATWTPPSQNVLDDMVDQANFKGLFVLEIHGFKPVVPQGTAPSAALASPARKSRPVFRANGTISTFVYRATNSIANFEKRDQIATLQGISKGKTRVVNMETQQIVATYEELTTDVSQLNLDNKYRLRISIQIGSRQEAEQIFDHFSVGNAPVQDCSTHVWAAFSDIFRCPEGRTILQLSDWEKPLGFGLEVTMSWRLPGGGSILTVHNRQLRNGAQMTPNPTTPVDTTASSKIKLKFVYTEEIVEKPGLFCPHEGCETRNPSDIEDLRMHLDGWHDLITYRATNSGLDEEGFECWRFDGDVANHKADRRASAKADEPLDVRIVAPRAAFNRKRYLKKGDDEYHRVARLEKRPAAVKPQREQRGLSLPKIRLPKDVQERTIQKKPKYVVPKPPPGIVFFRSETKRPLLEGEVIEESDDEVDVTWIAKRRSAEFDKSEELSEDVKRFLKMYDAFMHSEGPHSDFHAGESLIRFAREYRTRIWQSGLHDTFTDKVNALLLKNIITKDVHAGSLGIVEAQMPDVRETREANRFAEQLAELNVGPSQSRISPSNDVRTPSRGKGKARVTENGQLTPITADSDGDVEMRGTTPHEDASGSRAEGPGHEPSIPHDLCLCGKDAQVGNNKMIACSRLCCIRRQFHYDCIKGPWSITTDFRTLRKQKFVCKDCKTHPTGRS